MQASNQIYQSVVSAKRQGDETQVLDILDQVDPGTLDLTDPRILHMIYDYVQTKAKIREYTFGPMLDRLKSMCRPLYQILIHTITWTQDQNIESVNFEAMQINDQFFKFLVQKFQTDTQNDLPNFNKYISDSRNLHKRIGQYLVENPDTDFMQIQELRQGIENNVLKHLDLTIYPDIEINAMRKRISNILKTMGQSDHCKANQLIDEFKQTYGPRSARFIESISPSMNFLIKESYEHAIELYQGDHELKPLSDIPEIDQCIKFSELIKLISSANKLRMNNQLEEYDKLSIIIQRDMDMDRLKSYEKRLAHNLRCNELTYQGQIKSDYTEYYEFLITGIENNNSTFGMDSICDIIRILFNKRKYWQAVTVYEKFKEYFNFVVKKGRAKRHIETVSLIIISHNKSGHLNATHLITDFLNGFKLSMDYFVQRPGDRDKPSYKKVAMIYDSAMKREQWELGANGYKMVELKCDQKNEKCALCDGHSYTHSVSQGQEDGSMVQCGTCHKFLHSKCCIIELSVHESRNQLPGCLCEGQFMCELIC